MTRRSKLELLDALRPRHGKASKKAKGHMLDEFCATTKYNHKYAIQLLRHGPAQSKKGKRGRHPRYGRDVIAALVEVWQASGHICGKRLHPFLPEQVEALERHGELRLAPEVKRKPLPMSPATIDRRLQRARSQLPPRGRTTTKPGTLLKSAIPIRTFADWDDARPGFLEIDLVAHCGPTTAGEYLHTLSAVDIVTRWYEPVALPNRSEEATSAGIRILRHRLPFPLLGLDSDSGGEFINHHLYHYCQDEHIVSVQDISDSYAVRGQPLVVLNKILRRGLERKRIVGPDMVVGMLPPSDRRVEPLQIQFPHIAVVEFIHVGPLSPLHIAAQHWGDAAVARTA